MLDLTTGEYRPGKGWTRRKMLSAGFLGLGGLTLADLFRLRSQAGEVSDGGKVAFKDRAVILLWMHGGPSHLETYDLKPEAPSGTRSMFNPIRTNVLGLEVCELLPRHARIADKLTLLRSVAHDEADHGFGTRRFLTGSAKEIAPGSNGASYFPSLECGVNRTLGMTRDGLPVSVNVGGFAGSPWRGPGYWGSQYSVLETHVRGGRAAGIGNFRLRTDSERLGERRALLGELDSFRTEVDQSGVMDTMNQFQRQAVEILTSTRVADAFDLSKEDPRVASRYVNKELLLARRLVESGVNFVNVYIQGRPPGSNSKGYNWDDHAVNWDMPTALKERLPWYDDMVATLIEDVYQRGLDDRVMIIACGEFGRSPRIGNSNGRIGRDHWPGAMSILVSGGGRQRGDVIGATNSKGEHPITKRYDPHDFLATVYRYLGVDHHQIFIDPTGRPLQLTRGTPIEELV